MQMQRVMSSGGRRKNSMDALAKFRRAQELVQDIENIIEQEIATTPSVIPVNYEGNIARVKKSKRKTHGLIKNYNSKKIRQVVNNMEYDPDAQKWIGNEEILSVFSPQMGVIVNRSRHDREKVVGNMTWDPVAGNWKGNEKDARRFSSPRKPALITPLGSSAYLHTQKDGQGMVFDPVLMRWVGNDTELDVFAQIDKLDEVGVAVGNEFHLPSPLAKSFIECANRHKSSLSGWFADGGVDRKNHLYAIRNMSILRVVRDIKHRRTTYVDLDDNSADVPERDVPSHKGAVESGNGNSADAAEDYGEFDLAGKAMPTKLKLREVGADDWAEELEFDDETEVTKDKATNINLKPSKPVVDDEEEDWGSDFAEADTDMIKTKLKSPRSAVATKPFETNNRGSIVDLASLRKAGTHKAKLPVEEDADGLDIPSGPLRLVPANKRQAHATEDDSILMDEPAAVSTQNNGATSPEPDYEEEEEEDWNDVDIPSNFPTLPSKHNDREQWDNDNDIQITSEVLTLKKPTKISDDEDEPMNSDEDMLDGLVIPDHFVPQLRR